MSSNQFPKTTSRVRRPITFSSSHIVVFLVQLAHHFFKDCDCRPPVSINHKTEDELSIWRNKAVKNTAITTYEVKINYDTKEVLESECTRYGCVDHLSPEL